MLTILVNLKRGVSRELAKNASLPAAHSDAQDDDQEEDPNKENSSGNGSHSHKDRDDLSTSVSVSIPLTNIPIGSILLVFRTSRASTNRLR
jgi:hypothetical protein